MEQLKPTPAVFIEERFIRDLFCSRLSTICSTRAALPHVEVAQDFQAYAAQFLIANTEASEDAERVFALLNDDGNGINNALNTAVGYRLSFAAELFKKIQSLPTDMLNVPVNTPVEMPARFTAGFVDAQIRLDAKPKETCNHLQDMVTKLRHVGLIIQAIKDFVEHPLESNSRTVYSTPTKAKYDELANTIQKSLADAGKRVKQAAKIIERYVEVEVVKKERVALQAFNNLYVMAHLHQNNELLAVRDVINDWEIFDLYWLGNDKVALRAFNGLFVQANLEKGGQLYATNEGIQGWETFTIHYLSDNKIALQGYSGCFVSAQLEDKKQLVANRPDIQGWESFRLVFL